MTIIDIGHTAVMLPAAGAIAAWLILGKAWKLALWWGLILAAGLGVVALSKVAYLGWGMELEQIGFQALSGHAWRATAVIPVFFFLMSQGTRPCWRTASVLLGVAFGIGLGGLLVRFDFHTVSEVLASTVLGLAAVLAFVRVARNLPAPSISPWAAPIVLLAFIAIWAVKPSSLNHRLVDVALYFSGRELPYQWSRGTAPDFPAMERKSWNKACQAEVPD